MSTNASADAARKEQEAAAAKEKEKAIANAKEKEKAITNAKEKEKAIANAKAKEAAAAAEAAAAVAAAARQNPTGTSSGSAESASSSSEGFDYKFYGALLTTVVGIGCLIASIVLNVQMGGGTNNNQEFKQHLPAIFIPACIGAFILFIGIAIFIVQTRPSYALYGLLAVVCISLGISVAALSTSVAISQ